ncbi:MAG TPA: hypothetical protein VF950_23795 [Planctomycetota bacterium]
MSPKDVYAKLANGESADFPGGDLLEIERAGFVGLRLESGTIRAWKGKDGPCWETGRSATYKGSAAAALDDDKHLLFGTTRLCEKTARVYKLPPYAKVVDVTEATVASREPLPFDCDTFEADAAKLAASLSPSVGGERASILYPGPFKLLILKDGTIVRRGRPVRAAAGELLRSGEALPAAEGVEPDNYLHQYKERGALCLLGDLPFESARPPARTRSMDALVDAAEPMRRRLVKLIERKDDYFLLVGSDPADQDGCCPSDDVGHANALVKAGVLEAWTASAEASCPSTVYAFSGEIASRGERPAFVKNEALRADVLAFIRSRKGIPAKLAVRLALILVLLAGASLALWALAREVWK